jgi:hypothetical protein
LALMNGAIDAIGTIGRSRSCTISSASDGDAATGSSAGPCSCTRPISPPAGPRADRRTACLPACLSVSSAYLPCADCSTGFCMVETTLLFTREPLVTFWSGAAAVAMASW